MTLQGTLESLVQSWGYGAVTVCVAVECAGLPTPGETALVFAALSSAANHRLGIGWIVVAGAVGGTLGGAVGYAIGRIGGVRLLTRFGPKVGLSAKRQKVGRYLFARHGGAVVFVGRFVSILRSTAAPLAGTTRMPWWRFFAFHAGGSIAWACLFGFGAWGLGEEFVHVARPAGLAAAAVALVAAVIAAVVMKKQEAQLEARAESSYPDK